MAVSINKMAPTAVVVTMVSYCVWPYVFAAPPVLAKRVTPLPEIAAAKLTPLIMPSPQRDPFKPGDAVASAVVADRVARAIAAKHPLSPAAAPPPRWGRSPRPQRRPCAGRCRENAVRSPGQPGAQRHEHLWPRTIGDDQWASLRPGRAAQVARCGHAVVYLGGGRTLQSAVGRSRQACGVGLCEQAAGRTTNRAASRRPAGKESRPA